mmetsp:Transcript_16919/g.28656  ORF Transcript_16919/g.28656 Transcript_16919/m.28656 type:complete len:85 (+) Transcript_16919:500-754(+)
MLLNQSIDQKVRVRDSHSLSGTLGHFGALKNIAGLSDESNNNAMGSFTQNEILRGIGMRHPSKCNSSTLKNNRGGPHLPPSLHD